MQCILLDVERISEFRAWKCEKDLWSPSLILAQGYVSIPSTRGQLFHDIATALIVCSHKVVC